MNKLNHKQSGFSLLELLITVAIIVILMAITFISYRYVMKMQYESDVKNRLLQVAGAQKIFRSTLRNGRYGALCADLKNSSSTTEPLIPDNVVNFPKTGTQYNCTSQRAINEWIITDDIVTSTVSPQQMQALKDSFIIFAKHESGSSSYAVFCIAEDGVVRKSTTTCSKSSEPVD